MSFETISGALTRQRAYSDKFFEPGGLSVKEKEEITKTFALSLHTEVSEIASAVNFKDHRRVQEPVDHNKLLYKSVDAFRYVLALLNLWEIDSQTFIQACEDKDLYLNRRHLESERTRGDRPVVIFDADDVIAEFRAAFFEWLDQKWGIKADINDKQYYSAAEMQKGGVDSETAFSTFIADGGFRTLGVNGHAFEAMRMCQEAGFWVQILTARPSGNLKCFYDTHRWLHEAKIPYDSVAFSPEKYLWLVGQDFYSKKQLVCVVDDSSKHASEFAKHGVPVIVPVKSYNEDTQGIKGITRVDFSHVGGRGLFDLIRSHA
jgi:hypothetical protein